MKINDKKLKQTTEKMVQKELYEQIQKEAKDANNRNQQLRKDFDKMVRDN